MTWFCDGLKFKCTGCGKCCTGAPGYTWVNEDDIIRMVDKLGISIEEFGMKYLRQVGDRYALLEHPTTYACVFLKDNQCTLYDARPKQCRTFPFWDDILESPQTWEAAAKECEGISDEGDLYTFEEILEKL